MEIALANKYGLNIPYPYDIPELTTDPRKPGIYTILGFIERVNNMLKEGSDSGPSEVYMSREVDESG